MKKRKKKRIGWLRCLKGLLVSVCIADSRKHRNRDLAGYRTVRILRGQYDRKQRTVVKLVVRLCGGDPARHRGWNGPIVTLDDPKEFIGGCRGIEIGRRTVPLADFIHERAFWRLELEALQRPAGDLMKTPDPVKTAVAASPPAARRAPRRPPPEAAPEPRRPRRPPPEAAPAPEAFENDDTPTASQLACERELERRLEAQAEAEIAAEAEAQRETPRRPTAARRTAPPSKPSKPSLAVADQFDGPIPPLAAWQGEAFSAAAVLELKLLLRAKPQLLVHRGRFKHDPGWYLDLPGGSRLELAGYGEASDDGGPITATCLRITAWQEPPQGKGQCGTSYGTGCMPAAKVAALVQRLCKQHAKARGVTPQAIEPQVVPPPPATVARDDDYFDV